MSGVGTGSELLCMYRFSDRLTLITASPFIRSTYVLQIHQDGLGFTDEPTDLTLIIEPEIGNVIKILCHSLSQLSPMVFRFDKK